MISVVIPAFNEQEYIARCLKSLEHQDYLGDLEVIVVDCQSTDETAIIARSLGARVVRQGEGGIAPARQSGFMAAKGEIIASTDADTVVPKDWLSQIERLFAEKPEAIAVAGHFLLYDGPAPVRFWIKISWLLMPYIIKLVPWLWNFSGTNFAVQANIFNSIGGFNTEMEFGEDADLCQRLRRAGEVLFEPGLLVETSGRAFSMDRFGFKHLLSYLNVSVFHKNNRAKQ